MSDLDTLHLWHEERLAGQLWCTAAGIIGFRYDAEWIVGGGFAVSRPLPLAAGEFAPEAGTSSCPAPGDPECCRAPQPSRGAAPAPAPG